MKQNVTTIDATLAGSIDLADEVFGVEVRKDLLARAVDWQLAKRRSGNHKAKTIAEIQGTSKKPYAQKGTGRARQGSLRSPQFRGGARIFGPVVRSHEYDLPKKVRVQALKCALSAKVAAGQLIVLDAAAVPTPKTKELAQRLDKLKLTSALFVGGAELDKNFTLAARNIPNIDVLSSAGANVYDIMRRDMLVLTKDAVAQLEARLK
jgi:large subunit ribosomal protein L4